MTNIGISKEFEEWQVYKFKKIKEVEKTQLFSLLTLIFHCTPHLRDKSD